MLRRLYASAAAINVSGGYGLPSKPADTDADPFEAAIFVVIDQGELSQSALLSMNLSAEFKSRENRLL